MVQQVLGVTVATMDPRLLPMAPFVYFGKRYRLIPEHRTLDGPAQRSAYNLWRVVDGTLRLGSDAAAGIVRPDSIALSGPGTAVELVAGSTVHHLAFDVVHRPRYSKRMGCVIDVRMPPQPRWEELFERPLPAQLPDSWCEAAKVFMELAQDRYWRSATSHLKVNARLFVLLADLLAWQLGETSARPTGPVEMAEALIAQRASCGVTVADIAAELGLSRAHLTERFVARRGYGPGKGILRRRLESACHLLERDGAIGIEEVARRSGFSSGSALRRAFRRELGMAPSQWRWHRHRDGR